MKYLKWAGYVILALVVIAFVENKDDATRAVVWCAAALGYMIYQVGKAMDENHKRTVKMYEHLLDTINKPRRFEDSGP